MSRALAIALLAATAATARAAPCDVEPAAYLHGAFWAGAERMHVTEGVQSSVDNTFHWMLATVDQATASWRVSLGGQLGLCAHGERDAWRLRLGFEGDRAFYHGQLQTFGIEAQVDTLLGQGWRAGARLSFRPSAWGSPISGAHTVFAGVRANVGPLSLGVDVFRAWAPRRAMDLDDPTIVGVLAGVGIDLAFGLDGAPR